jgi:hypothetical protein
MLHIKFMSLFSFWFGPSLCREVCPKPRNYFLFCFRGVSQYPCHSDRRPSLWINRDPRVGCRSVLRDNHWDEARPRDERRIATIRLSRYEWADGCRLTLPCRPHHIEWSLFVSYPKYIPDLLCHGSCCSPGSRNQFVIIVSRSTVTLRGSPEIPLFVDGPLLLFSRPLDGITHTLPPHTCPFSRLPWQRRSWLVPTSPWSERVTGGTSDRYHPVTTLTTSKEETRQRLVSLSTRPSTCPPPLRMNYVLIIGSKMGIRPPRYEYPRAKYKGDVCYRTISGYRPL